MGCLVGNPLLGSCGWSTGQRRPAGVSAGLLTSPWAPVVSLGKPDLSVPHLTPAKENNPPHHAEADIDELLSSQGGKCMHHLKQSHVEMRLPGSVSDFAWTYLGFEFCFRTGPWGGWNKGMHLLQRQLGVGEDQPERRGALRGGEGQAAPLLRLLEKQLRLHWAGEERLLVRRLQLLWQVIA